MSDDGLQRLHEKDMDELREQHAEEISRLKGQLSAAEREGSLLLDIAESLVATSTDRVYIAGIGFVTAVDEDQWYIPDGTRGRGSEAFTGNLLDLVRLGQKYAAEDAAKKKAQEPTHVD